MHVIKNRVVTFVVVVVVVITKLLKIGSRRARSSSSSWMLVEVEIAGPSPMRR